MGEGASDSYKEKGWGEGVSDSYGIKGMGDKGESIIICWSESLRKGTLIVTYRRGDGIPEKKVSDLIAYQKGNVGERGVDRMIEG